MHKIHSPAIKGRITLAIYLLIISIRKLDLHGNRRERSTNIRAACAYAAQYVYQSHRKSSDFTRTAEIFQKRLAYAELAANVAVVSRTVMVGFSGNEKSGEYGETKHDNSRRYYKYILLFHCARLLIFCNCCIFRISLYSHGR